jgi:hypothetical protein
VLLSSGLEGFSLLAVVVKLRFCPVKLGLIQGSDGLKCVFLCLKNLGLNVYVRFCASLLKNCWGWLTHTDREWSCKFTCGLRACDLKVNKDQWFFWVLNSSIRSFSYFRGFNFLFRKWFGWLVISCWFGVLWRMSFFFSSTQLLS